MEPNGLNDERLFSGIVRLNAKVLGLVLGIVFGLVIFVATNWLLIKGGHYTADGRYVVGPHLQLLGPGERGSTQHGQGV